jgi:hypothetical protein
MSGEGVMSASVAGRLPSCMLGMFVELGEKKVNEATSSALPREQSRKEGLNKLQQNEDETNIYIVSSQHSSSRRTGGSRVDGDVVCLV